MLTDLEHAILGVIHLEQPCTAYAVRAVFAASLSSHWSGSAGAIYPALRRMQKRSLVRSAARKGDGRGAREYQLTAPGRRALAAWVGPPRPDGSVLMAFDPLRVRFRFLSVLTRGEARRAITAARQQLSAQLARIQKVAARAESSDIHVHLAHRGAMLGIQAQLDWLSEVMATVTEASG